MLKSITIKNFKSIESMHLELGRINLFLGANGCGKSNILEALGIVSSAVYGIVDDETLLRRGVRPGVPKLYKTSNKKRTRQPHISFDVEAANGCEYHVSLLNPLENPKPQWSYKTERFVDSGKNDSYVVGVKTNKNPAAGGMPGVLNDYEVESPEEQFIRTLREYAIYNPNTPMLRGLVSDPQNRLPVGLSGGGLAEGLLDLLVLGMDDEDIEDALTDVISLFPWVKRVGSETNIGAIVSGSVPRPKRVVTFIDEYMKDSANKFSASDASEGILYALFLAVLCLAKEGPKMFSVDNIDQALNPRIIQRLMGQMKEWFEELIPEKQILCTAHNPAILDDWISSDDSVRLFIVDRDSDGLTVVKRFIITEELIKLSQEKHISLSRMWVDGYLGGVPNV